MAGDPGVEYPRETIEGSDFEINSLIRLFIRQLKTDSSQFGQIFSQTNFWSKYSYFFFISLKMFIDSGRQVFELRLLNLKRKSTCTSGCDRLTTKSKSQRNSNFWEELKKLDRMGTKMQIWNAASIRIPGERASDEIRRSEVLKNVRQGWVIEKQMTRKNNWQVLHKRMAPGHFGRNNRTTVARHQQLMATQSFWQKMSFIFCFWFAFFNLTKTLFLFFLTLDKFRSNQNTRWVPDRKTNFDHAGHFLSFWAD